MSSTSDLHDPGGRTRLLLPDGVVGDAAFSPCGRYRHWLSRDWTPADTAPRSILFVGLNPSVADADTSDPTCARELAFAQAWGFTRYLKANLMDWRVTNPRDLPTEPEIARSPENLSVLRDLAQRSEIIVMATGNVPKRFGALASGTLALLRASQKPLMCLGHNQNGSAKHPLYLRKETALRPF